MKKIQKFQHVNNPGMPFFKKVMHVIDLKNSSLQCDTQIKYYKK